MNRVLEVIGKSGRQAFSSKEFAALLGKKNYARQVLHRLKAQNKIVQAKRGWWAMPNSMPEAAASEISKPAYVSFHNALNLHGLTTQSSFAVQLAVNKNAREYAIFGTRVREYKVKKEFFNNFFSKDGVLLASAEKAFADCLNLPRACPDSVLLEALRGVDAEKVKPLCSKNGLKRLKRIIREARKNA